MRTFLRQIFHECIDQYTVGESENNHLTCTAKCREPPLLSSKKLTTREQNHPYCDPAIITLIHMVSGDIQNQLEKFSTCEFNYWFGFNFLFQAEFAIFSTLITTDFILRTFNYAWNQCI